MSLTQKIVSVKREENRQHRAYNKPQNCGLSVDWIFEPLVLRQKLD